MSEGNPPEQRLREHPEERFVPPEHIFDLRAAAQQLIDEQPDPPRGQRQKALYRHGRVTIALFVFDAGAGLPAHKAAGAVTINVLEGHLRIDTPQGRHELTAGTLLVLASGVQHDVKAEQRSTMLLQVHLDEPAAAGNK